MELIEVFHEDKLSERDIRIMLKTIYDDYIINKPEAFRIKVFQHYISSELQNRYNFKSFDIEYINSYNHEDFYTDEVKE